MQYPTSALFHIVVRTAEADITVWTFDERAQFVKALLQAKGAHELGVVAVLHHTQLKHDYDMPNDSGEFSDWLLSQLECEP